MKHTGSSAIKLSVGENIESFLGELKLSDLLGGNGSGFGGVELANVDRLMECL